MIEEITRATQLSPGLGIAHFQLGLLHMARADFEQARHAWQPLDRLGENDALRLFKEGMVQFLDENYNDAVISFGSPPVKYVRELMGL